MNAKILLALFVSLSLHSAFAQGTIIFGNNFAASGFRAPIYDSNPANGIQQVGQSALGLPVGTTVYDGALLSGSGFSAALYAGGSPNNLRLVGTVQPFRTDVAAGYINSTTVTIDGVPAGSTVFFQIRAWSGPNGFDQAFNRGASQIVQSGHLGGTGPSGLILSPITIGWTSFSLGFVPEPSVFALGALGLGVLLLRRRTHS